MVCTFLESAGQTRGGELPRRMLKAGLDAMYRRLSASLHEAVAQLQNPISSRVYRRPRTKFYTKASFDVT